MAGTLKAGDHVDVVGTWDAPGKGTSQQGPTVARVILRNLLVLTPPAATATSAAVTASQQNAFVQLRLTDAQTQKLLWIQKNSVDNGQGWHLALRPPNGSLDSSNTVQDSNTMQFDGAGRRPH